MPYYLGEEVRRIVGQEGLNGDGGLSEGLRLDEVAETQTNF